VLALDPDLISSLWGTRRRSTRFDEKEGRTKRAEERNRNSRMLLLIVELEEMVQREERPRASNLLLALVEWMKLSGGRRENKGKRS